MGDRAWQVPQDQFVKAWNGSESLDEAAARIKELAGGTVPRWAVMAGEGWRLRTPPAIRITTAALQADEAEQLAADLAEVLAHRVGTYSA